MLDNSTLGVAMLISILPKYDVAPVVGFVKGKSVIHIARSFMGRRRNFVGQNFWAGGNFVSTVGLDETLVREYIKKGRGGLRTNPIRQRRQQA